MFNKTKRKPKVYMLHVKANTEKHLKIHKKTHKINAKKTQKFQKPIKHTFNKH